MSQTVRSRAEHLVDLAVRAQLLRPDVARFYISRCETHGDLANLSQLFDAAEPFGAPLTDAELRACRRHGITAEMFRAQSVRRWSADGGVRPSITTTTLHMRKGHLNR